MTGMENDRFSFDLDAQREFAVCSGDFNPMHLDEHYARRTMYGGVVAHGVNVVLTALNHVWEKGFTIRWLKVRFQRPVYLHEELSVFVRKHERGRQVYEVVSQSEIKLVMEIERAEGAAERGGYCAGLPPRNEAAALDEIKPGRSSDLELYFDETRVCARYPHLCDVGGKRLAAVLAATRIVGMLCPGEHSIFSELELGFDDDRDGADTKLHWKTTDYDERFRLVRLDVSAPGVRGRIAAFNRPRPYQQPTMREVASALAGQIPVEAKVLVVGGSRGLGETTAKILAVRGCRVFLTYRSGEADAKRVREEIQSFGADANAIKLDLASDSGVERACERIGAIDALFYFASPPIFRGSRTFSAPLFQEFIAAYVTDFEKLMRRFVQRDLALTVFYPSTVAVSAYTPKMLEYAAAKAAGEQLCHDYSKNYPNVRILVERLPRLPSDQTQTLVDAPVEVSAVDCLSGIVDKVLQLVAQGREMTA